MTKSIVQFGTSRFLQAHVDLMLTEAAAAGQHACEVTVVETTGSPASRRRVAAFAANDPCIVHIRGLGGGREIDEKRRVSCIAGGLSARADFAALCDAVTQADYLVSNTGDAGYGVRSAISIDKDGWQSFPELLTLLLHRRFVRGGRPVTLMPCELVPQNGSVLKALVMRLAAQAGLDGRFLDWLDTHCIWCNSLVDRIVSEPIEPIGAVAEPYALWAIENQPGFVPPCAHPDIVVADDIAPFERQKLFLLNLAHTLLAQRWMDDKRPGNETVRAIVGDPAVRSWLCDIVETEIVPAFADRAEATGYWATCLDRFDNPFLAYRLADIAQNHAAKIDRRAGGFIAWAAGDRDGAAVFPKLAAALRLDARVTSTDATGRSASA